jgi:hypothetical protein
MRYLRTAGALAVAAALAVPVAASAHPSAYTGEAQIDTDPADGPFTLADQTRHFVINHGFPLVLAETNGLDDATTDGGVISYALLPGDYRDTLTGPQMLDEGNTAAQPHATCQDPALTADDAILDWQGEDPFYGYVPFQKASAGLDDDPADWIGHVKALTGADLATVSDDPDQALVDLEALCTGIGGTFFEPDATQNTSASLSGGLVEPLEEEIAGMKTALTAAEQARDAARAELAAAQARFAAAMPELSPLAVTLPTARFAARSVAGDGMTVTVTGSPLRAVSVQMLTSRARAKSLRLRSRVLAGATGSFGADGTAEITLKPKARVGRALRRLRSPMSVKIRIVMGDRAASARGTLTR